MIGWVIIIILVVMAFFILKTNHFRHRMWVLLLISIAIFLILSVTLVYNKNNLEFNSTEGVLNSVKIYFGWLANGFQNLKAITGNAIGLDWTSTNKTFFDKKPAESGKK